MRSYVIRIFRVSTVSAKKTLIGLHGCGTFVLTDKILLYSVGHRLAPVSSDEIFFTYSCLIIKNQNKKKIKIIIIIIIIIKIIKKKKNKNNKKKKYHDYKGWSLVTSLYSHGIILVSL